MDPFNKREIYQLYFLYCDILLFYKKFIEFSKEIFFLI